MWLYWITAWTMFLSSRHSSPMKRMSKAVMQQARMITRTVAANHTVETMSLLHTCWWMLTGRVIMT